MTSAVSRDCKATETDQARVKQKELKNNEILKESFPRPSPPIISAAKRANSTQDDIISLSNEKKLS